MADYVIKEPKYNWLEITINNEIKWLHMQLAYWSSILYVVHVYDQLSYTADIVK